MDFGEAESRTLATGGGEALTYLLRRTARRRTVGIFVEPDGQLSVLAPAEAATNRIEQILRRRLPWIRRQRKKFEAMPPPTAPRQWVAGETHRYLGRQYRLKLICDSVQSARLVGGYFVVALPDPGDRPTVRRLMEQWYRDHAEMLLGERVLRAMAATTWLDIREPPPIAIRSLKQRWGSTTKAGRITFNADLVKLPLPCIDYVVAHELVHVRIPNHSSAFWRMLSRVMPDWRRWRERLERVEV